MAATVNEEYSYDVAVDDGGSPEAGVTIYGWNSDETNVVDQDTGAGGTITTQWLRAASHSVTGSTTTTTGYNPFTIRALKYGFQFLEISKAVTSAAADTFFLAANPQITESNPATVAGYSGISVNHGSGLITITASVSIEQLYDYMQLECVNSPQYDYLEILTTGDGVNYACVYDITVNGASAALTGTGKFLDLGSATFTLTNGGSTTMTVTDVNGTSVTTTIVVKALATGLPIQGARVFVEADAGGPLTEGTEILNTLTNASGEVSDTRTLTAAQPITGRARKATSSPYYRTAPITGTISNTTGLTLTVQMVKDE